MTVDSGVEPDKAEEAQAAILAELDRLCAGPIEEEELEDCRRGLLNGLESLADSLSGLENWYIWRSAGAARCVPPPSPPPGCGR